MNIKIKCYYAHSMLSYGSTIEKQDVDLLTKLGFEVINPNQPEIELAVQEYIIVFGRENCMNFFKPIIDQCDIVAFRGLPNGDILSGIGFEINYAKEIGLEVIELPCNLNKRMLDYSTTKQTLIELGFYKATK